MDDIKARLTVEDVVGAYVQLKKTGRSFKACCPFHAEKNPSFVVSPEKQLAYCFGCHKGGDIFTFVQEIEGVDFAGAVRILADKAGLRREDYRLKNATVTGKNYVFDQQAGGKERLFAIHETVTDFYRRELAASTTGESARHYLEQRGLDQKTVEEFRLGYAPDSFDLTHRYLLERGFSRGEILAAGLAVSQDTGGERIYDRFRHRLIFPIFSHSGQVVAFGGRVIRAGDEPKYLNSPETELYNKSAILYGFKDARAAIKESGFVVVVEGYMDVIASHRVGVKNVVASSGTAISEKQGLILKRLTDDFRLCFDADEAGYQAARRAVETLSGLNVALKIVSVEGDKDPDELIRHDPEQWLLAVQRPIYHFDFFLRRALTVVSPRQIEGKKRLLADLLPLVKKNPSSLEQDECARKLAAALGVKPEVIYAELKNLRFWQPAASRPLPSGLLSPLLVPKKWSVNEYFLGLLSAYPDLIPRARIKIGDGEEYLDEAQKNVYLRIVNHYNTPVGFGHVLEQTAAEDEEKRKLDLLALYAEEKNGNLSVEARERELDEVCGRMVKDYRRRRLQTLKAAMAAARERGEDETKWVEELNALIKS